MQGNEPEVNILGISAFYHDSAACLVRDGQIIAAAQEERFTRKKHDPSFPKHALEYCLREGCIQVSDLNYVAFYEKPFLKFDRILHSYLAYAPAGLKSFLMAIPLWIRERIWMKELIRQERGCDCKIIFPKHHQSLGLLYSAFTYFTGFRVNSGEYKLMGLAPYGEPKYVDLILRELIDLKDDGSFRLNMKYFNYGVGLTMTNAAFNRLFDRPPRQ